MDERVEITDIVDPVGDDGVVDLGVLMDKHVAKPTARRIAWEGPVSRTP